MFYKYSLLAVLVFIATFSKAQEGEIVFSEKVNAKKNIIAVNVLNILNNNVHIGYERIIGTGYLGVKLSVNYNLIDKSAENNPLKYQRDFTTGLDFNIYPAGQGRVKYFLGPSVRVGIVSNSVVETHGTNKEDVTYDYWGVFFTNGLVVQPTQHLYTSVQVALGVENFSAQTSNLITGPVLSTEQLGGFVAVNVGYRF